MLADDNTRRGFALTKDDFVTLVAEQGTMSKAEASRAVDAFCNAVTAAMQGGDDIKLPGFGSFETQDRGERQGRNLRTGEPITIAASKAVRFSVGSKLKAAVNAKTEQSGTKAVSSKPPSSPQTSKVAGEPTGARRRGKAATAKG